jgi:LPS export ABC transporter protein LptC
VIFKQVDAQGQLLWEIQASKAITRDPHQVHLYQVRGTFYQQGKAIYHLQARQGQIRQQPTFIQLQGPVIVRAVDHHTTLHSQQLQWYPQSGYLTTQSKVTLEHPHFQIQGQRLQASTRTHHTQITGQVTVNLPEQGGHLQADRITWWPQQHRIQASNSQAHPFVKLLFNPSSGKSVFQQRAQAEGMELWLRSQQLILHPSAQVNITSPRIQLNSQKLILDLVKQQWQSSQPIKIQHQGITATAQQGKLDRSQGQLQLLNQVKITGLPHDGHLQTQQLSWNLITQQMNAQGNLVYQQSSPWLRLTGIRAVGNLRDQTLAVQGGRVRAELLP